MLEIDKARKDIRAQPTADVVWNNADPAASLGEVRRSVERECQQAIDWYWSKKRSKSSLSQTIQFSALALTASAGIAPIVVQVVKNSNRAVAFDSGPLASLFVGLAAALLGLDKAFGFSSGWTRYVLTATSMTKLLHEFRLDWVAEEAAAANPPTLDHQASLIRHARDFVSAIQSMVLQETKDWATEFQSNMAQIEKDLKSQLDALKARAEKASQPAPIELTVTNADKTDGYRFEVTLEGQSGRVTDSVSHALVWTRVSAPLGACRIAVDAQARGSPVSTSAIIETRPGETTKMSLTLPIAS